MEAFITTIASLFETLNPVSATYGAALMAILVGTLHLLFRRWLTAGQLALLWGLVLLRLMIPVAPENPWSLQSLVAASGSMIDPASASPASIASKTVGRGRVAAAASGQSEVSSQARQRTATRTATPLVDPEVVLRGVLATWFIVGIGSLAMTLGSQWRFGRRLRRFVTHHDARLTELWNDCRIRAAYNGHCQLAVSDQIETPAVTGLLRPIVILPPGTLGLADDQLRMILLHELAHLQRRDVAANWLLLLIRTVHWWNPIYWLAARRFRMLCEQACDERVLAKVGPGAIERYGKLLLELANSQSTGRWHVRTSAVPLGIAIASLSMREIRGRLHALGRAEMTRSRGRRYTAVALILSIAVCGLTDASVPEPPQDLSSWMAEPLVSVARKKSPGRRPPESGPREQRSYEIAQVLAQLAKPQCSERQTRIKFESLLKLMFPAPAATYAVDGTTLHVDAPASLHERLERILAAWNDSGMNQILVRSRIIRTKHDVLADLGIEWQLLEAFSSLAMEAMPRGEGSGFPAVLLESRTDIYRPAVVATLSADQAKAIIDEAQDDRRANTLQAPSITLFNGQEAMLVECVQQPYVVGVRQRVGTLASVNEPRIVAIDEGTKINVCATRVRGKKSVELEQRFEMTSVGEVTTAEASLRGQRVTIQVPHVDRCMLNVVSEIADGQTLLVGCLPTSESQEYLYFLLTVEILDE